MNIEDQFKAALQRLYADAELAGTNLTKLCKEAGISRTTPDRWRNQTPETVATLAKLQNLVDEKKAAKRK